ncbi:MAG: sarcosine oxidase subunit gamma family protein [Steroidobacteraceae bacterium]|jgi:sarcosine oxidase, subunit gamma
MLELDLRRQPSIRSTDWLRCLPSASRWILHGGPAVRALAAPVWGVELSETACRAALAGSRAALWLGPDEYLLLELAPGERTDELQAALAGALEQALAGTPHALVDVSHRQFALEVSGAHAATMLNAGCPLDLDLTEFPVGMCTRTVFAKADVVLWRTRADAFHVEVWRSFAGYVSGLLAEIAREFYPL